MRIAVLHNHPIHYKHLLFTALASRGIEVDVIFAARSSNLRTASLQPAGDTYRSHFLSDGSFEALPQGRTALRAVLAFERLNPDIVIIGGYSYLPTWSVLAWANLRRKPTVLWFESNLFDHPRCRAKELMKQLFVSGCDVAHVYGQSNRDYLECLGMKPSTIQEKRATVDSAIFMRRRALFHAGFRRFIFVGRFSAEKNLPRLLEAFRTVRNSSMAELVLVGYGPDEQLLRDKVRDLGLDEAVVFTGPKTQEEVCQSLAEADCLLLPSLSETWGLVVNEALCVGIPVIVSSRCGCAKDLATAKTGWVVDAENVAELVQAMATVCSASLQHLEAMGEAGVKQAVEYSPDACAKRIARNLEDLLNRYRARKGLLYGHA